MPVTLVTSKRALSLKIIGPWCSIGTLSASTISAIKAPFVEDIAEELARAFDDIEDAWIAAARKLSSVPSSILAHMPACAANASDFGQMLAWTEVVKKWIIQDKDVTVLCDDPWMYRHLAALEGIKAGPPPLLWKQKLRMVLRGYVARIALSVELFFSSLFLRGQRKMFPAGSVSLLVYGHPQANRDGEDGYFGDMMKRFENIVRVFHVDCRLRRAKELTGDKRNFSLHAWGAPMATLALPLVKWRPKRSDLAGPNGWLVRRAAAIESGTAQPAIIRWQQICQSAWLEESRPKIVSWPWENHSWERVFVRDARKIGTRTVGYQHATIGRQELNYFPTPDKGIAKTFPETIVASGPVSQVRLKQLGYTEESVVLGGALRTLPNVKHSYDQSAPIFVALPFDRDISAEMVDAFESLPNLDRDVLIKDHPMTPYYFMGTPRIHRTNKRLQDQGALSAVVYSATTVGLEAILAGLPTFQFLPSTKIALDILPDGLKIPSVTFQNLGRVLCGSSDRPKIRPNSVFSEPDYSVWRSVLFSDGKR